MASRRALLVVENETVPADRRVWWEACALRDAGWHVRVLCPRRRDDAAREELEGVSIRRCRWPDEPRFGAHAAEYGAAMGVLGSAIWSEWRRENFEVLHVASPPDVVALLGRPYQRRGARLIFDHHDLSPELWVAKGGADGGRVHRALVRVEKAVIERADVVVTVNETYRDTVLGRVDTDPDKFHVVMNGVDLDAYTGRATTVERPPWGVVLGYVGSMGSQDGVESVVEVVAELRRRGLDVGAVLAGDGPVRSSCMELGDELGVTDRLRWLGQVPANDVAGLMMSFDVGLSPDPPNPFNHRSTMIKTLEYMAAGVPIVAHDLVETRRICDEAAVYAAAPTSLALADAAAMVIGEAEISATMRAAAALRSQTHDRQNWIQPLLTAYGDA